MPESVRSVLRPPERLTVSQWCDQHRRLNRRYSATEGPWQTSRVPYLREIMDAAVDPRVSSITFVKCSRVGGTEFLNNVLAYSIDCRPMPTLYILPTENDVHDEFGGKDKKDSEEPTGRLKALIEDSPKLAAHIPNRANWATVDTLELDTMTIHGAAAAAPGQLIRKTAGVIIFDEIDNCESSAGRLGNTLELAIDRLTTFGYRSKWLANTTPSVKTASGWRKLEASDFRKYYVPCPLCGVYQVLSFSGIKIPETQRDPDVIEAQDLAWYECSACHGHLRYRQHYQWMVDRGIWVPRGQQVEEALDVHDAEQVAAAAVPTDPHTHAPTHNVSGRRPTGRSAIPGGGARGGWRPSLSGPTPITRHRGYWIWSGYSPWRTWSQIIAKFLRVKDDPLELRVFKNSWLAEPWEETIKAVEEATLAAKVAGSQPPDHVPHRARVLVCSADVQEHEIYYVIRAWGPKQESWLIRAERCATLDELYEAAFHARYPVIGGAETNGGQELSLHCQQLIIDSGYRTEEVYDFAHLPQVYPCKGWSGKAPFGWLRSKNVEYTPRGQVKPDSIQLYHVNTFWAKSKLHSLAALPAGHQSEWHLNSQATKEYLQHLTAEKLVVMRVKSRQGQREEYVWTPVAQGRPNHWLDCEANLIAWVNHFWAEWKIAEDSPRFGMGGDLTATPAAAAKGAGRRWRTFGGSR